MNPKQLALSNKQRERQQRGSDFEEEIRNSLRFVPDLWTINIKDGLGGSRPGDRIIITTQVNILSECKRTASQKFELSYLRMNQLAGLVDFDSVVKHNYGLVFISFHNPKKKRDEAYAFRLTTALRFMQKTDRQYITLDELRTGVVPSIYLKRINEKRLDLKGVVDCKSL